MIYAFITGQKNNKDATIPRQSLGETRKHTWYLFCRVKFAYMLSSTDYMWNCSGYIVVVVIVSNDGDCESNWLTSGWNARIKQLDSNFDILNHISELDGIYPFLYYKQNGLVVVG